MAVTHARDFRILKSLFHFWRHPCRRRFVSAGYEYDAVISNTIHESSAESDVLGSNFQLYDSHIPTSILQKAVLTAGSAIMALYDPTRADMVATLGETTGLFALRRMQKRMTEDPVGQHILEERPQLNSLTLDYDRLRQLPDGTFGREYVRGMDVNGIEPDRDTVKFVDDTELAYVMQRYREVHDFVHTLAGLSISVPHEIAVKWYEMIQTGLPMCALSSIVAPLRLTARERANLRRYYIPWAVYCGFQSKFFMNVYFEKHFNEPIDDLRQRMNFIPAPKLQGRQKLQRKPND
ncbi:Ubiquinone biosynthesis protein COQ4-like protein [Acropora cervicornis]|uniref:Ubiquinone biosynthesis protein COQ4 homolog, mitochondrial n=1 Tax=Acropora cervicornis TaxID=6130 RepID=A0AAD9VAD1_ACRCE|nr:Ubiquinone biosynthesis protein COQ4-like protein [Acropora cervicornis]